MEKNNPLKKRKQEPHRVPRREDRPKKEDPDVRDESPIEDPKRDRPL